MLTTRTLSVRDGLRTDSVEVVAQSRRRPSTMVFIGLGFAGACMFAAGMLAEYLLLQACADFMGKAGW